MATSKKNFNALRQKPDFLGTQRKSAFYISFSPLLSRVSKLWVGTVYIIKDQSSPDLTGAQVTRLNIIKEQAFGGGAYSCHG
jgi:hypothetical protein